MQRIEAEFEIVTPMFLGGADNATAAELRVPSIKGMLRFWWRALAWGRLDGDLDTIRAEEARIFGSADERVGQGTFQLTAGWLQRPNALLPPPGLPNQNPMDDPQQKQRRETKNRCRLTVDGQPNGTPIGEGARYLGYGLVEAFGRKKKDPLGSNNIVEVYVAAELSRPCLFHRLPDGRPARFKLSLIARTEIDATVIEALKLFGLLGGLGSRTRRGWGSVALARLNGDGVTWTQPSSCDEYAAAMKEIITTTPLSSAVPSYSAFHNLSELCIVTDMWSDYPLTVMNDLGDAFLRFRGWRHPSGERNFRPDHDGFKNASGNWNVRARSFDGRYPPRDVRHPLRVAFGLPHNYSPRLKIEAEAHDRRGSPLFFHVHRVANRYVGTVLLLPTEFLPQAEDNGGRRRESIKIINGTHNSLVDDAVDYGIVKKFLHGFRTPAGEARDYLGHCLEVLD